MVEIAGGLGAPPSAFNAIAIGAQPSHPFAGQIWIDDTPDNGVVPYIYKTGGFTLMDSAPQVRLLSEGDPNAVVSSEVADTVAFALANLSVPTASAVRLNLTYTTSGSGSPLARVGLRINATTVNSTAASNGYPVEAGANVLSIYIARRDGGTNMGFFHQAAVPLRVGITAGIPSAIITDLSVRAQMLGPTRSVTFQHYELWEYR